ncbi:MAG: hypothetical protein ACR2P5_01595 [Gammaproteobacteria bacterium]
MADKGGNLMLFSEWDMQPHRSQDDLPDSSASNPVSDNFGVSALKQGIKQLSE